MRSQVAEVLNRVSGEEERLQRDFKTVNRLLGTNV